MIRVARAELDPIDVPQDVFGEHVGVRIVPAVPAPIHESVNEHNILRGVVSYHRISAYR